MGLDACVGCFALGSYGIDVIIVAMGGVVVLIVLATCFFVVLRLILVVLFTDCDVNYGY